MSARDYASFTSLDKGTDVISPPVHKQLVETSIHLDSKLVDAAKGYTHSSYKVYLKTPIKDVVMAEVSRLEMPFVRFNVKAGGNSFDFVEAVTDASGNEVQSTFTVTVPPGHYSEYELADELSRILTEKTTGTNTAYTVTLLRQRMLYHISVVTDDVTWFKIVSNSGLPTKMGFTADQSSSDVKTAEDPDDSYYTGILLSDTYVNLTESSTIYLQCDELENDYFEVSYDRDNVSLAKKHFAVFTATAMSGMYFNYNSGDYPNRKVFYGANKIPKLSTLTIRWVDRNGDALDFQDMPHTMSLRILSEAPRI